MASVSVIDLSGIGPAFADRLNELGLFTTEDLLRTARRRLAELVVGVSVAQVRRWQAISELLELNGMALPLAEGLYAAGIEALDELANRSLGSLRDAIEGVRAAGGVQVGASDDELVNWMKDAVLLRNTGTLNGTVLGAQKLPLAGVAVTCMGKQAESDARGRFRIRRLPLGRPLLVHLVRAEYRARTVQTSRIAPPGMLVGEEFRLVRGSQGAAEAQVLSELKGDVLPALAGARVRTRAQAGPPSESDILRVFEVLDNGDARLASSLLDYEAGAFAVRTYRFKKADVPDDAVVGAHLRFVGGRWQVVKMSGHDLRKYRATLRDLRLRPTLPANPTPADVELAIRVWMAARAAQRHGTKH